ncbi:MAG TPA: MlaE family lipid ABC transporter permease subunit [Burkholderiales bacterium]|nr:MlaE family lipid ABC transporter permease subunit [Burkholderiales bacterium]
MAETVSPQYFDDPADLRPGSAPSEALCVGAWVLRAVSQLERRLAAQSFPGDGELVIDAARVTAMDTSGAWLLHRTIRSLKAHGRAVRVQGLRPEFDALFRLVVTRAPAPDGPALAAPGLLARIGRKAWDNARGAFGLLTFLGEAAVALSRALARPRRIRWRPILYNVQTAGFEALPITGTLSFLLGIVIAYQGAEQLRRVGANVYIADLVGLSMVRELSPLITAIIVAGRSGSAYTAQIGTMKVTEEVDALRTVGVPPMDQLVLPKMLALMLVLPLLTVYTDVTGILGGMLMARAQLDVSFATFFDRLGEAVSLTSYLIGVGKAPVFAAIIALVGCYQGFQVNSSAESVGRQTTVSVVQSIFLVILSDAFFSIAFSRLDL